MNNQIIITTINEPTEAVLRYSEMKDYKVIVVGDKKTPKNWICKNVEFLSINKQLNSGFKLNNIIPYNHYSRKMLGYLYAISKSADIIIDTDDDNIPNKGWQFPPFDSEYDYIEDNKGFINIYQLYTNQKIWPRGFPIDLINKNTEKLIISQKKIVKVGVWQGLANEDPDVDALYRLTDNTRCVFKNRAPLVLGKFTISPFNSQNTAIRKELFALLYLPTFVTFRFTDILRSLVAQPIMWLYDYNLGFVDATVRQNRNEHDFFEDFKSEIPMYLNTKKVINIVDSVISHRKTIIENLYSAYEGLYKNKIVCKKELKSLAYWIDDYEICKNVIIRNK